MNTCKKIQEYIVFYDGLNEQDQEKVDSHLGECTACRQYRDDTQMILRALKQRNGVEHLSEETLTRYAIQLCDPGAPDCDGTRLSRREIKAIKRHLRSCDPCQQHVAELQAEYGEIYRHLENEDLPPLVIGEQPAWWTVAAEKTRGTAQLLLQWFDELLALPRYQLVPIAATALGALFVSLWLGPFFRGEAYRYERLASIEFRNSSYANLTRGADTPSLAAGLRAFDAGEYQLAIRALEQFIADHPDDDMLFYAHQVAGLAYLARAHRDFLGRFQHTDAALVRRAISHLRLSIEASPNSQLTEDGYWYLGSAYLLLHDAKNAAASLQHAVELNGPRSPEARQRLAEINALLQATD